MNSARSRGSQSSRYRRVGSGREVDESLFGASPRTRNAGASIVSGATLNTLRDSNATFVSSGDLQRIMQSTRIETNESIRMKQEAQEEERAVKQRVARERKGRMAKKAAAVVVLVPNAAPPSSAPRPAPRPTRASPAAWLAWRVRSLTAAHPEVASIDVASACAG